MAKKPKKAKAPVDHIADFLTHKRLKPGDKVLAGQMLSDRPQLTAEELRNLPARLNLLKIDLGDFKRIKRKMARSNPILARGFINHLLIKNPRAKIFTGSINEYDRLPQEIDGHLKKHADFKDTVLYFPFYSKTYAYKFPHHLLHPGCVVHIAWVGYKGYIRLSDKPFRHSQSFSVIGGRPDVEVMLRHRLPFSFIRNLTLELLSLLTGKISQKEIKNSINKQVKDFRVEDLYIDEKEESSPIGVINSVVKRLDLCEKLSAEATTQIIGAHQLSLVIYLYLTCFDLLGQPNDWMTFDSWINAKKLKIIEEKDSIIKGLPENADYILATQALVKGYNQIYGVKSSFYNFMDNVLTDEAREKLLASIRYTSILNSSPDKRIKVFDEFRKKEYLLKVRNSYTHKARFQAGLTIPFPKFDAKEEFAPMFIDYGQFMDKKELTQIGLSQWPSTLRETVLVGLAEYIRKLSNQK
ncbi:hypothetical protein [Deinococcus sp. Leaf326]|uniref:hypothetical protein n=1 Tax=Deinococcus sp. Leaf326 TaxID=1736338 RepID=UPI000B1ACA15|nr:hypothetical protein [Deinococcus sp. Leaf326]